jgi:hypothetical protein
MLCGCSLFGDKAATPGTFENLAANTTNVPMITVRAFTNYVTITNTVQVPQVVTVNHTNEVGVVVPVYQTNYLTVTNFARETNVVPAGTVVQVPQITGPSVLAQTGLSALNSVPGWGMLAATILGIGFGAYKTYRNSALEKKYTGATQDPVVIVDNLKTVVTQKQADNAALAQAASILSGTTPPKV